LCLVFLLSLQKAIILLRSLHQNIYHTLRDLRNKNEHSVKDIPLISPQYYELQSALSSRPIISIVLKVRISARDCPPRHTKNSNPCRYRMIYEPWSHINPVLPRITYPDYTPFITMPIHSCLIMHSTALKKGNQNIPTNHVINFATSFTFAHLVR